MVKTSFIGILLLALSSTVSSGIYTCKDVNGQTIYSDTPDSEECVKATEEKIKKDSLPALNTSKSISGSSVGNTAPKEEKVAVYSSVKITSPGAEENVRSNIGSVNVSFTSTPKLLDEGGHKYVVMLGGQEVYKGKKGSLTLENVDRGTHSLTVKIVNSSGKSLVSSEPVQFTLHRYSTLHGNANSAPRAPR